jgi:GR25 family glycosyltransferase involved in LPS biosynthesis
MDIYLALFYNTYLGSEYKKNLDNFINTYKSIGIKDVFLYTEENLPLKKEQEEYFEKYKHKRGYGYWAWKPIVIRESLARIKDKDVVLYHDAGREPYLYNIKYNIKPLVEEVIEKYAGIGVPTSPFKHIEYCKRDAFYYMKCDEEFYWNLPQVCATWSIWEKNSLVWDFVNNWRYYAFHKKEIITDEPNQSGLENFKQFKDHRHDQALLTNLFYYYSRIHRKIKPLPHVWGWEKDMNNHLRRFYPHINNRIKNDMQVAAITLRSIKERVENVKVLKNKFEKINLEFNTIHAVDKANLSVSADILGNKIVNFNNAQIIYDSKKAIEKHGRHISKGEMACMLSHFLTWKILERSNKKSFLIIEDDIFLEENENEVIDIINNIPDFDSFDICYLNDRQEHIVKKQINEFYYKIEIDKKKGLWSQMFNGAYGYIITKNGVKKLLKTFTFYCNADGFLHRWIFEEDVTVLSTYQKIIKHPYNFLSAVS